MRPLREVLFFPSMPKIPKIILLIESSRASGRDLLRGIAEYARHHGPWSFYWEPGGLEKAWPHLKQLEADGIILRDVEKVEEVLAHDLPAIVVGHRKQEIPGLANVITDSDLIGRLAADHLLHCGLRHFAYCGVEGMPWSALRGESYSRRVAEAGWPTHFYPPPASRVQRSWKNERLLMAQWLETLPRPAGVMACNDDRAQQVVEACKLAGLKVPDEIAIIGADNDELVCELSDPPLSSVAINFQRAGFESARLLDQMILGNRKLHRTILAQATHIVARQSTDILSIEDPALAKALRFIRLHAKEPLDVNAAVQASGLSRRVLEKRFCKLLGRSILSEIRRVRVAQICRMLVETNQSVSEIALALGYTGIEHVARYFRQEQGLTPLAYRKQYGRG
jgi:LacI family transcriptional regulator